MSRRPTHENLAHGGCEVSNGDAVLFHPFRKQLIGNHVRRRDKQSGAEEERSEDVSLQTRQRSHSIDFGR